VRFSILIGLIRSSRNRSAIDSALSDATDTARRAGHLILTTQRQNLGELRRRTDLHHAANTMRLRSSLRAGLGRAGPEGRVGQVYR